MRQLRHEMRQLSREMILDALEGHNMDGRIHDGIGGIIRSIKYKNDKRLRDALRVMDNLDIISTESALMYWEEIAGYFEGVMDYLMRHSRD